MSVIQVPTTVLGSKEVWALPDKTKIYPLSKLPILAIKVQDGRELYQIRYKGVLYWVEPESKRYGPKFEVRA